MSARPRSTSLAALSSGTPRAISIRSAYAFRNGSVPGRHEGFRTRVMDPGWRIRPSLSIGAGTYPEIGSCAPGAGEKSILADPARAYGPVDTMNLPYVTCPPSQLPQGPSHQAPWPVATPSEASGCDGFGGSGDVTGNES